MHDQHGLAKIDRIFGQSLYGVVKAIAVPMLGASIWIGLHSDDDALRDVSLCYSKSRVDPGNIRLVAFEKFQHRLAILTQVVVTADHMDRHKHDVLHHPARILDYLRIGAHITLARHC